MSEVERYSFFLPDVGDVLNDPSLSLPCDLSLISSARKPILAEEEEGLRSRVVYDIPTRRGGRLFKSLSPPPTHLTAVFLSDDDRVDEESLEHWLNFEHPPPSLWIWARCRSDDILGAYLCTLLRGLPPHSHLSLFIHHSGERHTEQIVDALLESQCQVDFLGPVWVNPELAYELGRRCRGLSLALTSRELKSGSFLSKLLSSPDCTLLQLRLDTSYGATLNDDDTDNDADVDADDKDVDDDSKDPSYMIGISRALEGSCKLQQLDMRDLPSLITPKSMSLLVECIASPACPIHDLGINLTSGRNNPLTKAQRKSCLSILAHAFQSGSSLSKLRALRCRIDTDEAAACVVEILGSPESNCKVRLLDIRLYSSIDGTEEYSFFRKLQQGITPPRIECLLVSFRGMQASEQALELSQFLCWEHCSLLWLQCTVGSNSIEESLQTKIANSLEANYLLRYLHIPELDSPPATARAATFLARNRLYKSMGLTKEECMKPQVARLFLCGHGEVGKTTLCKSLLKLHSHPAQHSFIKVFKSCRCVHSTSGEGLVEPRTRGLEIHQLCFPPADQKLSIFDLGGQPDYHIFHHYFMTNTSHDLFILVGKYNTSSTLASQLIVELEYWLKFIVSHRNTVYGPNPRIILVINFFSPPKSQDLQARAEDLTEDLRIKYGTHLDFSGVFGIVALDKTQAGPILEVLKRLLQECLEHKPLIPRLCHDLLTNTLPHLVKPKKKFTCGINPRTMAPASKLFVGFSQIEASYIKQQNQQGNQQQQTEGQDFHRRLQRRMQAALVELHNTGDVIFFPPTKSTRASEGAGGVLEGSTSSSQNINDISPIITDPNWFCNKVIGNLLAPEEFSGKSVWAYTDVKQVLMDNGCPKRFVDEVLRYLLSLDFCFSFCDRASEQAKYFFPAVSRDRKLQWPPKFSCKLSSGASENGMHFYGRRLKCKDTERHLIPSGVFARLQVRLNMFCGVGTDQSYQLGYHWASFVTKGTSVMVRFGRVANGSDHQHGGQESNTELMSTRPLSTSMKEDDHPEWIDILLCCPSSQIAQQQATSVEYTIMNGIKELIFEICQAASRGIPTVIIEEHVLQHEAQKDVIPLAKVHSSLIKEGLSSHVACKDQQDIAAVDLLLPEELQDHVKRYVQTIQEIQEEFATQHIGEEQEEMGDGDRHRLYEQLHGDNKVLYDLLSSNFNRRFERVEKKMDNIMVVVKEIKQDVRKVMDVLQQAQIKIMANCSTRLLTQVLIPRLPAYPYLTNSDGKMDRLKNCLLRKIAKIRFLCEAHEEGPHEVIGPAGKEVVVKEGVLMKMAPFLVPTLTVLCCAARFAANAYLPGVAPIIFSPLLDCLKSIGITEEDLQSKIMPEALSKLFDGLDVQIQGLYDSKLHMLNVDEHQTKEVKEALQEILGSREDIDMEKDFGLHFVQVGHETNGSVKARWFCKEHAKEHKRLPSPKNPFSHVIK